MQLQKQPDNVSGLKLMQRLKAYADGKASWLGRKDKLDSGTQQACATLHSNLVQFAELVSPILDRSTAREMRMFTMHDHSHALKVAHIMWHILEPSRREKLTPPEIGLMVASAYFHDLGMALSDEERNARLDPESDMWLELELDEIQKQAIQHLTKQSEDQSISEAARERYRQRLTQAQEVLLCYDTRERHAKRERYIELLDMLKRFHEKGVARVIDAEDCLTFDGESFRDKLIDICTSHTQDVGELISRYDYERPVYAHDYPVGHSTSDLHMIAAVLRLADILDFDRERTPSVMFYYLLPGTSDLENRSVLEWSKHLTISHWHIDNEEIVFRGRSQSHIVHHAVVQFCEVISKEIAATRETFVAFGRDYPFSLPSKLRPDIHAEGYHYIPYKFELDDERVYELLMGEAIYSSPLAAVRELIQNAVDACKLRDALTQSEDNIQPSLSNRILVRYEEPNQDEILPRLIIADTGTGMDGWIIERYFLQVGQSYYRSSEFVRERLHLQRRGHDFAPVSEFGIGFLSSFLLADSVIVETARWEVARGGDTHKRTLVINGPTRLIRINVEENQGTRRFKGTKITLQINRGETKDERSVPMTWERVKDYIFSVCQDLPYELDLEYMSSEGMVTSETLVPSGINIKIPANLEAITIRIPLIDTELGLEGEIAFLNPGQARKLERESASELPITVEDRGNISHHYGVLLRGGFAIGEVPGLPDSRTFHNCSSARIRFTWVDRASKRYIAPTISRNSSTDLAGIAYSIERCWFNYLLQNLHSLPPGQLSGLTLSYDFLERSAWWLEKQYDALALYELARWDWVRLLRAGSKEGSFERQGVTLAIIEAWEHGEGESLWLADWTGHDYLYYKILNILLANRVDLQTDRLGTVYVKSPAYEIRPALQSLKDYISNSTHWSPIAEFISLGEWDIFADCLCFWDGGEFPWFNAKFSPYINEFSYDEQFILLKLLHKVHEARLRERRINLNVDEYDLFVRAQRVFGDLIIGSQGTTYPVASFTVLPPNR